MTRSMQSVRQKASRKIEGNKTKSAISKAIECLTENGSLFLESISIRGCSRIVHARSVFIRLLWITFLILTSVFLIISVRRIIGEYLLYSLNIETEEDMDAPTPFPSVTFCNHQPFSKRAYHLWRTNQVISPTHFNRILRQKADSLVNHTRQTNNSQGLPLNEIAHWAIVFDTIQMYYQNLEWPKPLWLGHERNETIFMCLMRFSGEQLALGGPGCHDDFIHITQRSHPQYFNCYVIEIDKVKTETFQELGLIIWLGPPEDHDVQFRQAFLQDVFSQAHGLRVAIHEPGQLADLDRFGLQIEPGRMNEISFEMVKKIHEHTPRRPCVEHPDVNYSDLDGTYQYDFELCLESHLQQYIVDQCGCLYAYLPRIALSNSDLPYCGRFLENGTLDESKLFERKRCVRSAAGQFARLRKQLEIDGECLHRCESLEYDSRVSVTTWRTTDWQLYWSKLTAANLEAIVYRLGDPDPNTVEQLVEYFRKDNLSESLQSQDPSMTGITGKYGFSDRHTYLSIKRKRNDTIVRKEAIVLTWEALVSRIGGLCSLYIGMTFAIFIEIIEFLYMAYMHHNQRVSEKNGLKLSQININQSQLVEDLFRKQTEWKLPEDEEKKSNNNCAPIHLVENIEHIDNNGNVEER